MSIAARRRPTCGTTTAANSVTGWSRGDHAPRGEGPPDDGK
ncbi:hypothetical protein AKJ09_06047 [Labilithrix luteola]|uniref:Uncharacterized protein n=1 Tax=Labilithrix luteola TaxID=1391654 RepID=A0A0K1Q0S1_9BACT|nr:hypothetical protein AKJ09_06047 [Labilithrix luteola]